MRHGHGCRNVPLFQTLEKPQLADVGAYKLVCLGSSAHQTALLLARRPYLSSAAMRIDWSPWPRTSMAFSPSPTTRAYPDCSCSRVLTASATASSLTSPGTACRVTGAAFEWVAAVVPSAPLVTVSRRGA